MTDPKTTDDKIAFLNANFPHQHNGWANWHTGGGCYAFGTRITLNSQPMDVMITDEDGTGTDEGPWMMGFYKVDANGEQTDYTIDAFPNRATLAELMEDAKKMIEAEAKGDLHWCVL